MIDFKIPDKCPSCKNKFTAGTIADMIAHHGSTAAKIFLASKGKAGGRTYTLPEYGKKKKKFCWLCRTELPNPYSF